MATKRGSKKKPVRVGTVRGTTATANIPVHDGRMPVTQGSRKLQTGYNIGTSNQAQHSARIGPTMSLVNKRKKVAKKKATGRYSTSGR